MSEQAQCSEQTLRACALDPRGQPYGHGIVGYRDKFGYRDGALRDDRTLTLTLTLTVTLTTIVTAEAEGLCTRHGWLRRLRERASADTRIACLRRRWRRGFDTRDDGLARQRHSRWRPLLQCRVIVICFPLLCCILRATEDIRVVSSYLRSPSSRGRYLNYVRKRVSLCCLSVTDAATTC